MRFGSHLREANRLALRAFETGWNNSAYAGTVAERFLRAGEYQLFESWLRRVLASRDRDLRVVRKFLAVGNFNAVRAAITVLGETRLPGEARAIAALAGKSDILDVRLAAYAALGRLGDAAALDPVLARFAGRRQPLPVVEEVALYRMLGGSRDPRHLGLLAARYETVGRERQDPRSLRTLKDAVIAAVAALDAPVAIPFLTRVWRDEPGARTLLAAAMENTTRKEFLSFIRGILPLTSQDQYLSLLKACGRIGFDAAALPLFRTGFDRFREYGVSPAPLVDGLAGLPAEVQLAELKRLLALPVLDFNTLAAINRIAAPLRAAALAPLVHARMARSGIDLQELSLLVDLLGELGNRESVAVLEPLLKHRMPGIRILTAKSLQKLTGKEYPVQGFDE